ncbi:MAG: hypothetical protein M3Z96_03905 [Pseudomonadota bacterium]|nr:hypothetical protein [Pseudomonadota bacterium]
MRKDDARVLDRKTWEAARAVGRVRILPYLTGGFTYGTIETFYSVATPGFFNAGSSTATRTGLIPHGEVFAPNFTVKIEYLFDSINARRVIFNPVDGSSIQFNTRTKYSYRPRWFELQVRLVVALSGTCRRKILKAQEPHKPAQATRLVLQAKRP